MKGIKATEILNPGTANGELLKLDEPLSFWGGYDPQTGRILDRLHPQSGQSVSGRVLAMLQSRGSAGTPAAIAESLRQGIGPVAILLGKADVNIAIGAMVADRLYGLQTPILVLSQADFLALPNSGRCRIDGEGQVSLT